MPGLMARILSRRADGAPPTAPDVPPADAPTVVVPAVEEPVVEQPSPAAGDPVAPAGDPLPAGAERVPDGTPSFRTRGQLRRRLRYLRQVRELGFRDLGGLVFDLDRFGRDRPDLVEMKVAGLRSIDGELRALEVALDDVHEVEELREPGIAACAHCGALHGSDARFCPACGKALDEPPAAGAQLPAAAPESAAAASAGGDAAAGDGAESVSAPEQPAA
jgi:hypothetical protein